MSAQSPPHPDYILSRTSCSLDDFFCNQFDISHDILHVKRILPSGITRADVSPGYGEIITETQLVHKSFKRIEQDTVKTLLIKNRQRALVHHRALVAHARQVRHCKRADISALHQEPHIMVGRSSRNLQGDIETTGEHTIPYGRVAPNSPWFCSELRGCSDRYPEDCVEGPRKAPRKWKSSVSAFCIAGSASSHGLNCSAPRLRGEQLVTESFCNISSVHSTDASDARVDSAASAWTRGEGASQSSSLRATVIPVYIPGVRSVPKGRSWCSLATNVVVEDQPVMQVAPYFGEDDREGVKIEPFDVAPGELEPPIVDYASVETVRYIIKKYTKNLSTEVAERFIKNGLITGRKDSSEVELELLKLHILLESVMKSLCDTLSASYKQVFLLAKKVIATPTNVPTNSRKPLYYTPHFIGSNHVGLNSQSDEYTDCIKINSDYFDVLESGGGEHRNDINLIEDNKGRTHTKHQTFSYAMAPLHMKAERVKSELHSTIGISQSGSRHQSMSPEKCKVSQHGFFEKNANILSSKGVKPDFRSTDSIEDAYTAIAESFQLLYCRRCYLFDCPLHKVELPVPRTRVELPQPPPSHITGVKLPYESLDCSVEENKDFSQLLKSPYCLYCTEATEDSATEEWSVVEQLLCLRLYDVFAADEDTEYSMAQIVERISRCIRTRSVAAVAAFLRAMFLSHGTSPIGRDHENQSTKRQKLSKFSSVKRFKNGKGTFNAALRPQKSGYDPCDHNGPCSVDNGCSCKKAGANCEKYCGCSFETCSIRFEGCRCKSTCTTGACPCAASGRECDPDLCSSCGAGVHPCFIQALKKDSESSYRMCGNVALRRGDRKRVAIGRSDVQGWGLFICEPASKGELIIEYKGEVISNEEAERRGVVYDKIGCSYLFDLANDLVVDSTRLGNAVKFMNHSDEKKSNCFPEIKVVDGEQRIGLYARRPIIAGEELTFDYKYTADAAPQWAKGK